jgi:uncharacterized protein YndB with AHSA1/START domain
MTETVQAVRKEIVVSVDRQRAFEIFTADMTSWWPSDHHIGSGPIQEIVIEPHAGGRWYTRHEDGTETSTGFVTTYDPPSRLVVTWQVGADWTYHPDLVTTVEVRFVADGPARTRVELEHRGLEAYGVDAAAMQKMFDGPGAWERTLAEFAAVAQGRA